MKACEAETGKAGQDYYAALAAAASPAVKGTAAKGSAPGKGPAASVKDEPAAQVEVCLLTGLALILKQAGLARQDGHTHTVPHLFGLLGGWSVFIVQCPALFPGQQHNRHL